MKRIIIALAFIFGTYCTDLTGVPAQVIIIRHGEKDAAGNLSQKGYERAGALAAYFAYTPELIVYGRPVAIFAARPTPPTPPYHADENTQRCIDTVGPTALFLRLPIHSGYDSLQPTAIASFILSDKRYDGKTVLICWHHESLQSLAEAFGIPNPPTYPGSQFDLTWVITYNPNPSLIVYEQELLYGDNTT